MKMLTLKRTDSEGNNKYIRVSDTTPRECAAVQDKVKNGWRYCSKGEWKINVRDKEVSNAQ